MFDSTNPLDIPQSATMVGGYVDGIYAWSAADWARFPDAVHVAISAIGTDRGVVGDVEPGCIWPIANAVPWVQKRRAAGVDPTIYCNETNSWSAVRQAFKKAGVKEPHYWCANYDGVAKLRPGQVARQYANPTLTKHHYDLSVVADNWPGVDGLYGPGGGTTGGNMDEIVKAFNTGPDYFTKLHPGAWSALVQTHWKQLMDKLGEILVAAQAKPAPVPSPIDPQVAKDLHTVAEGFRRLGIP